MYQRVIAVGHAIRPGGISFEATQNAVWTVTVDGTVMRVRLLDSRVDRIGEGYVDPVAVVPMHDGLTVAVIEADGTVLMADQTAADRTRARVVTRMPGGAVAAVRHPDSGRLLALAAGAVEGDGAPQLLACTLDDGSLTAVGAADLSGARALAVDEASRTVTVLAVAPDGAGVLTTMAVDTGDSRQVTGLPPYTHLVGSPDAGRPGTLLCIGSRLSLVDAAGTELTAEALPNPVGGLARWGSLVLAACGADLVAVEWGIEDGLLPLTAPLGPLYGFGYSRLLADLPAAGLRPGDVTYAVREGPDAGSISLGREPANPDGTESVMLLAGGFPGEYHVDAVATADGSLLARRRFRVTALWPDEQVGPPIAITGSTGRVGWGGSGGVAGYLGARPAPNAWRVLTVLVSLKDRGWDGLDVAATAEWRNRTEGVTGESARRFYEEASGYQPGRHGTTIVNLGVYGPVVLDEAGWGAFFTARKPGDVNAGWVTDLGARHYLGTKISFFFDKMAGGAQLIEVADSVTVVVRGGSDAPTPLGPDVDPLPTRYVWGHAHTDSQKHFFYRTAQGWQWRSIPMALQPASIPAGSDHPDNTRTLCHEIGHNLGLDDLYDAEGRFPAEVGARLTGSVDLMGNTAPLPHFSLANRLRLGWTTRAQLTRFDFSANPAGGTVVLQATETLTGAGPTNGRTAGIEVPIDDGWSYLFEYRNEQPSQIGDRALNPDVVNGRDRMVIGTDLRVRPGDVARPWVLRLGKDPEGDGPVLWDDGQNFRDSDTTNPNRMHDFTVTAADIASPDNDSARVEVRYEAAHRPQLEIQPAKGGTDFRSPDIRLVGPYGLGFALLIKGATNQLEITVHNRGTLTATGVRIHVMWLPFIVTAGSWRQLPDPPPFTVPGRGSHTQLVSWPLPASVKVGTSPTDPEAEHFCVRVVIDRYRDAARPQDDEIVVSDNWAQSNFDTKSVVFSSPSERISTGVAAANVLDQPATYAFQVDQSSDWYRIFLGNAWLRLDPGEARTIVLAYESLAGDPIFGEAFDAEIERITATDDHVAVSSWIRDETSECPSLQPVFGAGLNLRAGRRTWIEDVRRDGDLVVGRVRADSNGQVVDVTFGEFYLATWPEDEPDRVSRNRGEIRAGFGEVTLSEEARQDLQDGRVVWHVVGRPADSIFAAATTAPAILE